MVEDLALPTSKQLNSTFQGWYYFFCIKLQLINRLQILWDRWIGACLQHHTLIQLLCLGGFEDPQAIPWFKFIAICAGTLTDVTFPVQTNSNNTFCPSRT